jgi:hypothetical protein
MLMGRIEKDEPPTIGYAEGVVDKIKVIKRRADGLSPFRGFSQTRRYGLWLTGHTTPPCPIRQEPSFAAAPTACGKAKP